MFIAVKSTEKEAMRQAVFLSGLTNFFKIPDEAFRLLCHRESPPAG
jgi:hypothetical protein